VTAILEVERSSAPTVPPAPAPARRERLHGWLRVHRKSLLILGVLLPAAGLVNGWNLHGWPGRVNDDEGTYVNQAWAMLVHGELSHYTYWYDHPFLGWALIAGYAWLTDGFDRLPSAVMVGREAMLVSLLISCVLLFVLARRLRMNRGCAALAVAVFAFSPLAVYFHRMVFLDNLATMFILAAMVAAASHRRSIAAALWSAVWCAAAALCKETIVILLPALIWLLVQHTDRRTRRWNLGVFFVALATLVASYPVFALLKNELLPGPGHVSLGWAVWWQVFGRSGSGSLLDPDSGTFSLATSWTDLDPWLLLGGALLIPAGLALARLRPIALALLIQVVMMCRGGYLPFAYVIAMLPFAALLIAGAADALWRWRRAVLSVAAVAALVLVVPPWVKATHSQSTVDGDANSRAATRWVVDHVPRDAVVVTDDYIWMDLTLAGFTKPVWLWKVDTDPAVMADVLPAGAASIDYVVLADQADSTLASLPTLRAGIADSVVVARFGEIVVRRVST
jgi:4-amino-4-deoxy-L-arabinose transferase-like glycosyltransferase